MEKETTTTQEKVQPAVQQPLPNSTAVLVMGIISIPTCFCGGIIGLTLGIVAIVLSGKSKSLYNENPSFYTENSYKNLNAGRICAIIGTVFSGITFMWLIIRLILVGSFVALLSELPWESF